MPGLDLATRGTGDALELELAFDHPMESGTRTDGQGVVIPAHHLVDVTVRLDDEPFATLVLGPAVARNPVLTLALPAGRDGATLVVDWRDNLGGHGTRSLTIDDPTAPTR